jgi:hypothetical protein
MVVKKDLKFYPSSREVERNAVERWGQELAACGKYFKRDYLN